MLQVWRDPSIPTGYVTVHLQHYTPIPISRRTLRQELPRLNRRQHDVYPVQCLPYEPSGWTEQAAHLLFKFLQELDMRGPSTSLSASLNGHWLKYSENYPHGKRNRAVDLFASLLSMLHCFGCGPKIFNALSTFFAMHCQELLNDYPEAVACCLEGLDRTGRPISECLACVAAHPRGLQNLVQCCPNLLDRLSRRAARELERMVIRSGPVAGLPYRAIMPPPLPPLHRVGLDMDLPLPRYMLHAERRYIGRPRYINGEDVLPQKLVDIARYEPERLTVEE